MYGNGLDGFGHLCIGNLLDGYPKIFLALKFSFDFFGEIRKDSFAISIN